MFKIMTFYFHIVLLLNRYMKRWESSQVQYPIITPRFTFCGSYILSCLPFCVVWWLVPSYSAHDMNHPSVQSTQVVSTTQPVSHLVAILDIRWTVRVPQCCVQVAHILLINIPQRGMLAIPLWGILAISMMLAIHVCQR